MSERVTVNGFRVADPVEFDMGSITNRGFVVAISSDHERVMIAPKMHRFGMTWTTAAASIRRPSGISGVPSVTATPDREASE